MVGQEGVVWREREVRGRVGLAEGERERVREVAGLVLARGVGRVSFGFSADLCGEASANDHICVATGRWWRRRDLGDLEEREMGGGIERTGG